MTSTWPCGATPGSVPVDHRGRWAIDRASELEAALGARVDVQVLNGAPLGSCCHALNGRPLVVRDAEFFATLRERTWDDYFDFAPAVPADQRRRTMREPLPHFQPEGLMVTS